MTKLGLAIYPAIPVQLINLKVIICNYLGSIKIHVAFFCQMKRHDLSIYIQLSESLVSFETCRSVTAVDNKKPIMLIFFNQHPIDYRMQPIFISKSIDKM